MSDSSLGADLAAFMRAHPGVPQIFLAVAAVNSAIIAIFPYPLYTITRFAVCIYAVYYAYRYFHCEELPGTERLAKAAVFAGLAIIFMPLWPFVFSATVWIIFDVVGIILFRESRFAKRSGI